MATRSRKRSRNGKQRTGKRRFTKDKPQGMKESEYIGRKAKIAQLESEIKRLETRVQRRQAQQHEAVSRYLYHQLRLRYL